VAELGSVLGGLIIYGMSFQPERFNNLNSGKGFGRQLRLLYCIEKTVRSENYRRGRIKETG